MTKIESIMTTVLLIVKLLFVAMKLYGAYLKVALKLVMMGTRLILTVVSTAQ